MTLIQIKEQQDKYTKSLQNLLKTLSKLSPFDPNLIYSDNALELYDASGARFTRVYECAIKLFRAYDLFDSIEASTSYRELIHKMETVGWVKNTDIWMEMKIIRNKLNHEYLPFDQQSIYNFILNEAKTEFVHLDKATSNV
ncbi:MAG: nucleotidyltransferase substrate binding protein [Saprospiraceae bacterium]